MPSPHFYPDVDKIRTVKVHRNLSLLELNNRDLPPLMIQISLRNPFLTNLSGVLWNVSSSEYFKKNIIDDVRSSVIPQTGRIRATECHEPNLPSICRDSLELFLSRGHGGVRGRSGLGTFLYWDLG